MQEQTELSLQESEVRYRRLFEAAQDGILILDAGTGMIEDVNPYLVKMLGYSRKEFIRKKLWEVGAFKDIEASQETFKALQENETIRYEDLPLKAKDGRLIPVEFVSNVYLVGGEKVIQCDIRDISELRRKENAHLESDARFRRLVEHLPTVIYTKAVDATRTPLYISPYITTMLGYTPEEWLADPKLWSKTLHPEDRQHVINQANEANKNTKPFDMEYRMVARDGHTLWVHDQFVFVTDLEGQPPSWQGLMLDITARKLADEILRESEDRYQRLVETLPDGVIVHSQGQVVFANPASAAIIGAASPAELIGKPVMDFVHPDSQAQALNRIQQSLKEGVSAPLAEEKFARLDGSLIDVEVSAIPFSYAGKPAMLTVFNDITERKQAAKANELTYSQLTNLYNNLPEAVFSFDVIQNKMLQVSPANKAVFGYSPDEFMKNGQLWYMNILPEDKPIVDAGYALLSEGKTIKHEFRILRPDGKTRWIEGIIKPNLDGNGKLIRLDGISSDITERKQAEQALRESEERYRQLLEFSPDAIVVHAKGNFVFLNPAALGIYGANNAQELLGKPMIEQVHPDYRNEVKKRDSRLSKGNEVELLEEKFLRLDGAVVDVEVTAQPFTYQGTPAVQMVIRDITERKKLDEALRLSEEKYRSLVENVNDGFFVGNAAGVFTFANPALARMLGLSSPQDLVGRKFTDFIAPDMAKELGQSYIRAMQTGHAAETIKGQTVRADGARLYIEVKPSVILKAGQIAGTQGVMRDVTERKVAEEKIKRQLEHLTAMSAIDRVITANFDLKLSLSEILAHVTKELGVDAADILILDPNSMMLEFGAERGFHTKAIRKVQIRLGESHAGQAALERQLIQIRNLKDETDKAFLTTHLAGEEFTCYYGMPLIAKGQVKGVLEIFNGSRMEPDAEWFDFLNTLAGQTAIAIENSTLFESLQRSNSELGMAYDATIEGWSHALDLRDKETEGHTQRVTELTLKLAHQFGLGEADLVQVRWGALLHDIGKMGVPDGILLKPGPLTDEEWVVMKKHPRFAFEMLSPIHYLRLALDIPYCHHEKWDGSGYPRGLKGNQIPLVGRIFAVVDVWDALRSDRPYRLAWGEEKVREHIRNLSGTHFDPQVVEVFLQPGN
jgi:PAS domain S-box-containing protein/putative nucleotidyltransferase with HDIG domain